MSKANEMIQWMKRTSAEAPAYEEYVDSLSNQIQAMAHEAAEDGDYQEGIAYEDKAMRAMTEGFSVRSQLLMALNQSEYDAAISAWQEYKAKYEAI